jgi:hypothetical protein
MNELPVIRVFIRDLDGRYLAGEGSEWSFTTDITRARIFDYLQDQVAEQLDRVWKELGMVWGAVPADLRDASEVCDLCGRRTRTLQAFFDGHRFLCPECRNGKGP